MIALGSTKADAPMIKISAPLRSWERPLTWTGNHLPSSIRCTNASTPRSSSGRKKGSRPCDPTTSSTHTTHSACCPTTASWSLCQTAEGLPLAEVDRREDVAVDLELEDVRPPVVARHIQGSFGSGRDDRVALRVKDPMLFMQWSCHDPAARSDDHRVARVVPLLEVGKQLRALRKILRNVLASHRGPIAQHPAPALGGNVTHGRDPGAARVPGRRDVDLAPLGEDREPSQRHVVLPADQAPDPPHGRIDHLQAAGVSGSPYHPLRVRRHELAMAVDRESV